MSVLRWIAHKLAPPLPCEGCKKRRHNAESQRKLALRQQVALEVIRHENLGLKEAIGALRTKNLRLGRSLEEKSKASEIATVEHQRQLAALRARIRPDSPFTPAAGAEGRVFVFDADTAEPMIKFGVDAVEMVRCGQAVADPSQVLRRLLGEARAEIDRLRATLTASPARQPHSRLVMDPSPAASAAPRGTTENSVAPSAGASLIEEAPKADADPAGGRSVRLSAGEAIS